MRPRKTIGTPATPYKSLLSYLRSTNFAST